jgi:hypothetical protein
VDRDQGVEPGARTTAHEQLLVVERLQVPAGQLPVIVNTAIVPWRWDRDAAGILDEPIDPVEAAGVTLVDLPLPCVELWEPVLPWEPVDADGLVLPVLLVLLVLLGFEVPVAEVELTGMLVWEVPEDPVLVTEVGVVPTGVDDDVPTGESGALGSVDDVSDVPFGLDVDVGVSETGVAVGSLGSTRLSGFPGP